VSLLDKVKALLGFSAYERPPIATNDKAVEDRRKALGGQLQPVVQSQTHWFLADLDRATQESDSGRLTTIGQLNRAMMRDGLISGLLKTRTAGLVALPKRYRGALDMIEALKTESGTRSEFDEMCPPTELARLAADMEVVGLGVGELKPVVGRVLPVLERLDPQFVVYRWNENRYYYQSVAGLLPITPGDGRWVLLTRSRINPWQDALWPALGRAFIHKEHAILNRGNFASKLANPARIAQSPSGATENERLGLLDALMQWGTNTVFSLPPGYEAKVLESTGGGWQVFGTECETSNLEIMIALAGNVVVVDGGAGFSNADIHQTIRADLIRMTADALAHCVNTQILPAWTYLRFGPDRLDESPRIEWDTSPPTDRKDEADALTAVGTAIEKLNQVLAPLGRQLDIDEFIARYGIAVLRTDSVIEDSDTTVKTDPEPAPDQGDQDGDK